MRKKLIILLVVMLAMVIALPAYASSDVNLTSLSNISLSDISSDDLGKLKEQVKKLSDKDFDRFIVDYLVKEDDKKVAKEKLAQLDVQISEPKAGTIQPLSLEAWDLDLSVTAAKRGGESFWRLIAYYTPNGLETYPASYDALSVTWDPSQASYYSYSVSSSTNSSLKNYSQKNNGIIVFNVYDKKFVYGNTYYDAAYVTPKISSEWLDFGAKYVHTYTTYSTTVTLNPAISYTYPGLVSGSMDFTLTLAQQESSWDKADTNAIWIP